MSATGTALILGLGESGLAMARWLAREGWALRVADTRAAPPMLAEELAREDYPQVRLDDTLETALERFAGHPFERLPVLDADGALAGALYKSDVLLAFSGGVASEAG